jgi:acetyl esterase/lipase
MKNSFKTLLAVGMASVACSTMIYSQTETFSVTVDKPVNGTLTLEPAPPADGKMPAGTVIRVTATPDAGYVLDAGYYASAGRWGQMFYESMTPQFSVTVDKDKHIGASFIEKSAVANITVTQDVVYAKPGVKALKYDVFAPKGAKNLPCIIIIHGGGWVSNTEDIMRGMARELSKDGKYVVFSIDYRWAQKLDGDATNNTMADLIGDVYGAIAHIMEHAAEYGGDPTRIALTGDSAGGHLSAAAANMPDKIGKGGFGKTPGVFEFIPSYLPENKTLEQVREEMMTSIRAAAPSYGVFGGTLLNHYSDDPAANDAWKEAVAPLNHIPAASVRSVPQYLTRGTNDFLIKDEYVKVYVDALVKAGQRVQYVQVGGAGHAFFDWKPDEKTKATFYQYGVYYIAEMKAFFTSVLY